MTIQPASAGDPASDPLFIPDELLAYASAAELALYEAALAREAAELPGAPRPLPNSPGELAALVTGGTERQAPHLNLIDEIHKECRAKPDARFCLSIAPRMGKTKRLANWGIPWQMMQDPYGRFLYVTYGSDLSVMSSRWIRDMLTTQNLTATVGGEERRLLPRRDVRSVSIWELEGFPESGMIAVGLDGPLTGKGGHLICDDLIKNAADANSKTKKNNAYRALTETLMPRVDPGCFAVVVMARWAEDDPIGRLKVDDPNGWTFINVPELCEDPATDPVHRAEIGDPLWPAWRSLKQVLHLRATLPLFEAQYQGHPERVKRTGGIFAREKIDRNRWTAADPQTFVRVAVGVDPSASDSPESDEAGIICAARTLTGHFPVLDDASGRMEPDRWARVALLVALRHNADVLAYEKNLVAKMMRKVIDRAWDSLVADLATLRAALEAVNANTDPAARDDLDLLLHGKRKPADPTMPGAPDDEWEVEPLADADQLLALLSDPGRRLIKPRIEGVAAKVGKELRAEPVSQLYAQDLVHHVGMYPELEKQLTTWRPGQGSPDRMDACLAPGTLVLTSRGDVPVERVQVGDVVQTRRGWRPVLWSGKTRTETRLVVIVTDAGALTVTADHRVWTERAGWTRADALVHGDSMLACPSRLSPSPSAATSSSAGRTARPVPAACTTPPTTDRVASLVSVSSTSKSGEPPMMEPKYRPVTSSITLMTTRSTTTPRTSSVSPARNTPASTAPGRTGTPLSGRSTSTKSGPSRPSGTEARRDDSGTRSTPEISPIGGSRLAVTARRAASPSTPRETRSSVLAPALPGTDGAVTATMTWSTAGAASGSGRTGTPESPRPVPVAVAQIFAVSVPPTPVYDLTVEGEPEFFADGHLVHNCVHVLSLLADLGAVSAESAAGSPLPKPSMNPTARRAGMQLGGFGRPAGR